MRRNVQFKRFPCDKKTGRVFDSIYECAIHFRISYQSVMNYCNKKVKDKVFNIELEWVTIEDLCRKIRVLEDDLHFYKNADRFKPENRSNIGCL